MIHSIYCRGHTEDKEPTDRRNLIVDVVGRGKLRINGSRVRKAADNRQSEHSDNSADQTRSHTDQSARRDTQSGRYNVNNRGHGRGRGGSGRRGR